MKTKLNKISFNPWYLLFPFLALALPISCNKDPVLEPPVAMHYNYYPVIKGSSVNYQVDSIVYDDFRGTIDTFHYSITDKIVKEVKNKNDTSIYRVERYFRKNDTSRIQKTQVYTIKTTPRNIQTFQNNQRVIDLVFPVTSGSDWNGNAFNSLEEENFHYSKVHQSYSVNGHNFDSTVTVIRKDKENLIHRGYDQEVYASGTGMVFKEVLQLEVKADSLPDPDIPWEKRANSGYILRYKISGSQGLIK